MPRRPRGAWDTRPSEGLNAPPPSGTTQRLELQWGVRNDQRALVGDAAGHPNLKAWRSACRPAQPPRDAALRRLVASALDANEDVARMRGQSFRRDCHAVEVHV
jgi:hypothetical protein